MRLVMYQIVPTLQLIFQYEIPGYGTGNIILKFLPFCQLNEENQEWENSIFVFIWISHVWNFFFKIEKGSHFNIYFLIPNSIIHNSVHTYHDRNPIRSVYKKGTIIQSKIQDFCIYISYSILPIYLATSWKRLKKYNFL